MLIAPTLTNEDERIASLRRMLLLASPDEETFDRITRSAQRLLGVPIALVSLIDSHKQWFKSCIGLPVRETGRDVSFCGHAIVSDKLFVVEDATQDPRFADNPLVTEEPHVIFYAGRPLKNAEGYLVGTLCVIDHVPRTFTHDDKVALDDLGHWVEQVFLSRELSQSQKAVLLELDDSRRKNMLDPMLNIWNKAGAMQMLERESLRSFRNTTPLSIMMVDVDHFKQINDAFGHPAGDTVLIEISKRMLNVLRAYDSLGRFGGDEFIVLLPETHAGDAADIARRLLLSMQQPYLINGTPVQLSISIGIASADFVSHMPEADAQLEHADQALLRAKQLGKNRFEVFSPTL